jgi:deazaflavin-dependent oxidoreductase (nitroreductase family)
MIMTNPDVTTESIPRTPRAARWIARIPLTAYRLGLGDLMNTLHVLILTTKRTPESNLRHTPLEYRSHGSRMYVISSWGDRAKWVQGTLAAPDVTVQRGGRQLAARAERVTQRGELLLALRLFHGTGPFLYDGVFTPMRALRGRTQVTERMLPDIADHYTIVRLSPVSGDLPLPPVPDDLRWVLPAAGMSTVGLIALGMVTYAWRTIRQRSNQAGRD